MKILFNLHAYPPFQMSGAETMAKRIVDFLASQGHEIKVLLLWGHSFKDGLVEVIKQDQEGNPYEQNRDLWEWCDFAVTHLIQGAYADNKARWHKKPLVHLVHNSHNDPFRDDRVENRYHVYNSDYVKRKLKNKTPNIVCRPPVDFRHYEKIKPSERGYVTLINHNTNKGGQRLIEIAKKLPKVKFLAVKGGYQVDDRGQIKDEKQLNITYIEPHEDIRNVLKDTRVLIMPSEYESFGQTAVEAMACGIPVIVSTGTGCAEIVGDMPKLPYDAIELWAHEIKRLLTDKDYYSQLSISARQIAKDLDPLPQLKLLEQFLTTVKYVPPYGQ